MARDCGQSSGELARRLHGEAWRGPILQPSGHALPPAAKARRGLMMQAHPHQVDALEHVVGHRTDAADRAHGKRASRPPNLAHGCEQNVRGVGG
eukprot:8508647-Alexandrium_andersonii.AAC.1